jgi:hypothetical protein
MSIGLTTLGTRAALGLRFRVLQAAAAGLRWEVALAPRLALACAPGLRRASCSLGRGDAGGLLRASPSSASPSLLGQKKKR